MAVGRIGEQNGRKGVHRSYHYRLYPTRRQRDALDAQLRACCELYNAALEQRRGCWREHGMSVSYHDQSAELRELRRAGLLPAQANFWCQQQVLRRLDEAFEAFFARVACGETPGYPRFKAASRFNTLSFSFAGHAGGIAIKQKRLYLQAVGHVKVKWHRALPDEARLCQARITRRAGGKDGWRYYACIQLEKPPGAGTHEPHPAPAVGIDLGVHSFAALSTGEMVHGPRAGRGAQDRTRRLSRAYARTRRGSRRRRKAAVKLARQRERERNRRRDHAHKLSRELADRFGLIAVEELTIKGMVRSAGGTLKQPGTRLAQKRALNREIHDQAWGTFLQVLSYKAEEAGGRVVKVNPQKTSQTCAPCGHHDRRSRHGRRFKCVRCGHEADTDVNAAQVILLRALVKLRDNQPNKGPGRGLQAPTLAIAGVA